MVLWGEERKLIQIALRYLLLVYSNSLLTLSVLVGAVLLRMGLMAAAGGIVPVELLWGASPGVAVVVRVLTVPAVKV
jgi:hypothetical protein